MSVGTAPPTEPVRDADAEVVAYLAGRSAPCPRCGYDLRDIAAARCPECAEPLVLRIGTPRPRFGWLVVAMAPGCFSGVAAILLLVPIWFGLRQAQAGGRGAPWPILLAESFGFVSAASIVVMYVFRHRLMSWPGRRQAGFAITVWGVHVLMFALVLLAGFLLM